MAYKPIGWVDGETPLNAENLNHMDEGIKSSVRSINGITPDENGNVVVEGGVTQDWVLEQINAAINDSWEASY